MNPAEQLRKLDDSRSPHGLKNLGHVGAHLVCGMGVEGSRPVNGQRVFLIP